MANERQRTFKSASIIRQNAHAAAAGNYTSKKLSKTDFNILPAPLEFVICFETKLKKDMEGGGMSLFQRMTSKCSPEQNG